VNGMAILGFLFARLYQLLPGRNGATRLFALQMSADDPKRTNNMRRNGALAAGFKKSGLSRGLPITALVRAQ
jgi:hypothetical protein